MYAITKTVNKRRHTAVKQLQAILHVLGQPITVDGLFGNNTKTAIKQFQQENNLKVDGVIGKRSWLILYKVLDNFMNGLCDESSSLESRGCQAFNTDQTPFVDINADTTEPSIVNWLQTFLFLVGNKAGINGSFNADTQQKIKSIQRNQSISADGNVNDATWQAIFNEGAATSGLVSTLFLTDDYIKQKAEEEGLEPAAIKAVVKVESGGSGFYSNCQPKILFEGHKFWSALKKAGLDPKTLQSENEDIIYPKWITTHYTGNAKGEYDRLQRAKAIHEEAALKSASWGMFQIMGFNSKPSGFDNVNAFVSSMSKGENQQLDAFFAFLHHEGIFKYLKNKNWAKFAYRYNGSKYKEHGYDSKLQVAYDASGGATARSLGDSVEETLVNEYSRQLESAFAEFDESAS